MQSVNLSALNDLDKKMEELLKEAPKLREKLHEDLGAMALKKVKAEIAMSGLNDSHQKIRAWQESHTGSKGGYAAVRAKDNPSGDDGAGAVTNYLNSGHRTRPPSYKDPNYRRRVNQSYVEGLEFYQNAVPRIESEMIKMGEEFVEKMAKKIGGG